MVYLNDGDRQVLTGDQISLLYLVDSLFLLFYYKLGEIIKLCNKAGPVKKRLSCPTCRSSESDAMS